MFNILYLDQNSKWIN